MNSLRKLFFSFLKCGAQSTTAILINKGPGQPTVLCVQYPWKLLKYLKAVITMFRNHKPAVTQQRQAKRNQKLSWVGTFTAKFGKKSSIQLKQLNSTIVTITDQEMS